MNIARYIYQLLSERKIKSSVINAVNLKISSCSGCNYECFAKDPFCPVDDDIPYLYGEILKHDLVFLIIPVYSAAPCSMYFAWRERSQVVFCNSGKYEQYEQVKKRYILIGNEDAGGREAVRAILTEAKERDILLIQSHQYSQNSIAGRLIEIEEVKKKVRDFLEKSLLSLAEEER